MYSLVPASPIHSGHEQVSFVALPAKAYTVVIGITTHMKSYAESTRSTHINRDECWGFNVGWKELLKGV